MPTWESYLRVRNRTFSKFKCNIIDMEDAFQDSPKQFNNRTIYPDDDLKYRAELYVRWDGRFTMKLTFEDTTYDLITVNQYGAFGETYMNRETSGYHDIEFTCGNRTLTITVKNTKQQIIDHKVMTKTKQAQIKTAAKLYTEALKLYDEALSLGGSEYANRMTNLSKSELLITMADISFKNGFSLESQFKINEANAAFQNAKVTLENAKKISSNQQIDNKLEMVNAKIIGNELFNQGLALDDSTNNLITNTTVELKDKKAKVQQTLQKYTEAKDAFERGSKHDTKLFSQSLSDTQEMIENMEDKLQNLAGLDLGYKLQNLHMMEYEEKEKFQIEQHLEEQIDGIME